jgi:type I pantothenate kinase
MRLPAPIDPPRLAQHLAARRQPGAPLLIGITGSVAVGKSTLAAALADAFGELRVATVATDGFLRRNAELDAAGLTLRKGFPESYDSAALARTLAALRLGPAPVPVYSHVSYDVDPALSRSVGPADIILVEGLGLAPHAGGDPAAALDLLLYLDAEEADLEAWFVTRFMGLWHAAADDPASFYTRFRDLTPEAAAVFARSVWGNINLPNLREHISGARQGAAVVVRKDRDHALTLVRG